MVSSCSLTDATMMMTLIITMFPSLPIYLPMIGEKRAPFIKLTIGVHEVEKVCMHLDLIWFFVYITKSKLKNMSSWENA